MGNNWVKSLSLNAVKNNTYNKLLEVFPKNIFLKIFGLCIVSFSLITEKFTFFFLCICWSILVFAMVFSLDSWFHIAELVKKRERMRKRFLSMYIWCAEKKMASYLFRKIKEIYECLRSILTWKNKKLMTLVNNYHKVKIANLSFFV